MAYNDERARRIVFDLETAPLEDCAAYLEPVDAPANYKDQAKIDAYIAEKTAEQVPRCALDPDLCRIVALGIWVEGQEPRCSVASGSDDLLLQTMAHALAQSSMFIGFNCLAFDFPVLLRRALYLGIPMPAIQIDRFRHPQVTDLLSILSFDGKLKMRGLSWYCRRFGIDVPDDVKGEDIGALVAAGTWAAIEAHCLADVRRTGLLAARMGLFDATVRQRAKA